MFSWGSLTDLIYWFCYGAAGKTIQFFAWFDYAGLQEESWYTPWLGVDLFLENFEWLLTKNVKFNFQRVNEKFI